MKLSNKKVLTIVLLIIVALSGLVILQTILLKTALKTEEETFRSNAILALNKTVQRISRGEAREVLMKFNIDSTADSHGYNEEEQIVTGGKADTLFYLFQSEPTTVNDSLALWYGLNLDLMHSNFPAKSDSDSKKIKRIYSLINNDTVWGEDEVQYRQNDITISLSAEFDSTHHFSQIYQSDSSRIFLIEAALGELNIREDKPILERIDTTALDSMLNLSLDESKIDIDYSYGITDQWRDSLIFVKGNNQDNSLRHSSYRARLFPYDMPGRASYLVVHFPNKQFYIYTKLGSLIIPTALFMLIIIGCFIYTIQTIVNQRKTAHKLNDFINNMTHELKTPISTIKLAVEAIARDDVLDEKEKVIRFNNMIDVENRRMKSHVDKILQIATLEEGDYIIKHEPVNMNLILTDAVDSFGLHLNNNNGTITKQLRADNSIISGDQVHLKNIIYNLIDNALKYSSDRPEIGVISENNNEQLVVRIKDSGIGIHADDLKKVFQKYYRATEGDVHDVKGFGLGLSYVKMMTEAHGGTVEMISSLGKGTEVILTFPVAGEN